MSRNLWSQFMAHVAASATSNVLRHTAILMTFGLVLAGCSTPLTGNGPTQAKATTIATADPLPSSLCGSDEGDYVRQSWNGDFTGCVRVPNIRSSSFVIALAADLLNTPG